MNAKQITPGRFATYYFSVYASGALMNGYFPLWLQARGFSVSQVATLLAAGVIVKLIGEPIAAVAADERRIHKLLLCSLIAATEVAYVPLYWTVSFAGITMSYLLATAVWSPVLSLGDSIAAANLSGKRHRWGAQRLWGSVGVLTFLAIGSLGIQQTGLAGPGLIASFQLAFLICLVAALRLPSETLAREAAGPRLGLTQCLRLAISPGWRAVTAAAACIAVGQWVLYAVGSIEWRRNGYSTSAISLLWSTALVSEIAFFLLLSRDRPAFRCEHLLIFAGIAAAIRWGLASIAGGSVWLWFGVQALQGATLATLAMGCMSLISRSAQQRTAASTAATLALCTHAVAPLIAFALTALLYQSLGSSVFWIASVAALSAVALVVYSRAPLAHIEVAAQ